MAYCINESIVEHAALEWFLLCQGCGGQVRELVPQAREVGHGAAFALLRRAKPYLAPGNVAQEINWTHNWNAYASGVRVHRFLSRSDEP